MNSKGALKRLFLNSYTIEELSVIHSDLKDYDLVLQELDRLEKLKKENQVLLVNKNVAQGIAKKLKEENDKLKKVIKILKDKNVDIYELLKSKNIVEYNNLTWSRYDFGGDELTEEEYNLLKEVLSND